MRMVLAVYDALRTFDRAVTRAELERETGCDKRAVENGLCGLLRRGLLIPGGHARQRGMYELVAGAQRPVELRGRYDRQSPHRAAMPPGVRQSAGSDALVAATFHQAARPPSHAAQPGALRIICKGVIETRHATHTPFPPCALAELWPPKR